MKFPRVYPLTIPSSQSTMRIIAIVSSMCLLLAATRAARSLARSDTSNGCTVCGRHNGNGMLRVSVVLCFLLFGVVSRPALAQESGQAQPSSGVSEGQRMASLLAGAVLGLAAHESGHLMAVLAFGEKPGLGKVEFHG